MGEEKFCSIFEGKLGPVDIVRRYFMLFGATSGGSTSSSANDLKSSSSLAGSGTEGARVIDGPQFLEKLSVLAGAIESLFLSLFQIHSGSSSLPDFKFSHPCLTSGHRGTVEQMTLVFQAFDQYDLGILAIDDLNVLLNQVSLLLLLLLLILLPEPSYSLLSACIYFRLSLILPSSLLTSSIQPSQ